MQDIENEGDLKLLNIPNEVLQIIINVSDYEALMALKSVNKQFNKFFEDAKFTILDHGYTDIVLNNNFYKIVGRVALHEAIIANDEQQVKRLLSLGVTLSSKIINKINLSVSNQSIKLILGTQQNTKLTNVEQVLKAQIDLWNSATYDVDPIFGINDLVTGMNKQLPLGASLYCRNPNGQVFIEIVAKHNLFFLQYLFKTYTYIPNSEINNIKTLVIKKIDINDSLNFNDSNEIIASQLLLLEALNNDDDSLLRSLLHYGVNYIHKNINDAKTKCKALLELQEQKNQALLNATTLDTVSNALTNGAQVNCISEHNFKNALYLAIENKELPIVGLLIDKGINVNNFDSDCLTPLHVAAKKENIEIIDKLIEARADIQVFDNQGRTPLHVAAEYGCASVVDKLIKAGFTVNDLDNLGRTPMHVAAVYGHASVVDKLIKAGFANVLDNQGRTPLHFAAQGSASVVDKLIKAGFAVNVLDNQGRTPLHIAAQYGYASVVDKLIEARADIHVFADLGRTPLHFATECGNASVVDKLVEARADIHVFDDLGRTPLHIAADYGRDNLIEPLINAGSNINIETKQLKSTPLHLAVKNGNANIVAKLVTAGANVNVFNYLQETPLYIAAEKGYDYILKILLDGNANVNLPGKYSKTPLHIATENEHNIIAEELLKAGATFNAPTTNYKTAPHLITKDSTTNDSSEKASIYDTVQSESEESKPSKLFKDSADPYSSQNQLLAYSMLFSLSRIMISVGLSLIFKRNETLAQTFLYNLCIEGSSNFIRYQFLGFSNASLILPIGLNAINNLSPIIMGLKSPDILDCAIFAAQAATYSFEIIK